jgi:FSR family fosmidomycin resistance protein-like MFS transporter
VTVRGIRFGARTVNWLSILGAFPFSLMLPYANLVWTAVLVVVIGFIFSSAYSAIVVFAQELVPGHVGRIRVFPFRLCSCIDGV